VVAEIEDRALMKTFGEAGAGIFTAPRSVEADVLAKYRVRVIGRAPDLRERLYAITAERRIKHPAVSLITEAAREGRFS
jgi:LysR family transcriptional activator of nhaA